LEHLKALRLRRKRDAPTLCVYPAAHRWPTTRPRRSDRPGIPAPSRRRRRKSSSDGSAAIASATTSGGLQELERFFEALPDHLRIVSSAYGRACMSGYRDRQNAERLCVAAQS